MLGEVVTIDNIYPVVFQLCNAGSICLNSGSLSAYKPNIYDGGESGIGLRNSG